MCPFPPGVSGNKAGRKKGVLNRYTKLRKLLFPAAPRLIQRAVRKAEGGDDVMLIALLRMMIPPLRSEALPPNQLQINPDSTPSEQGRSLVRSLTSGHLTIDDAHSIMKMLSEYTKVIEKSEFEDRLSALEKEIRKHYGTKI